MKKTGKSIILWVLAATALLSVAGCAGTSGNAQRESAETEREIITFMLPQSHDRDFFQREVEAFELEYPQYDIEVQRIPDNQWIDVVKAKAAVREMPDIIRIDKGLLEDVGTDRFLEFDGSQSWYDRVLEEQLENKKIDGKLYGLPVGSTSSVGLVCNLELFERYQVEPPKNMEELRAVCGVFRDAGLTPFYASDRDSWTTKHGFCTAATQIMPEEIWEELKTNKLKWADVPEFVRILEEFAALRTDGLTNSDYLQATYDSAVEAMAAGRTAMYLSGNFFVNDVKRYNGDIRLTMVPGPYNGGVLTIIDGPGMFAVSADSPHAEAAKVFLEWFSQPDIMDEFNAGWNHYPVFRDQELKLSDWQQKLYDDYIRKGKVRPQLDEIFSGIDLNAFWSYQQDMMAGRMTAKEVLESWDISFEEQMRDKEAPGFTILHSEGT